MRTDNYNPSVFEVELASAILACKDEIQKKLNGLKIVDIENNLKKDNPLIMVHLEDNDGDRHELVIKVIQRPDNLH